MSKRVIPMVVVAPPPSMASTPLPPSMAGASKPVKGPPMKLPMDRFAMMRQVNLESAATAVDTVSAGQNHRERLQQESRRRAEVTLMEKEDYTFTQEGVDRLKRQEARLVMQEEDKRMRQLMKEEAAIKHQALEKERRRLEAEERQLLLDKHKAEMEAQKVKQEEENERKKLEREERMRKMKEASDRKAREEYLANEAVKKAALEKERQGQQEQMERLHMEIEDEAERSRMQKAAEDALIQAKVAAEEAKWKAWEEAEAAREATEQAARRAQKAAQYEEDKKRRMELHRLRKETENRLKRIEAMDHPTPLPPPPAKTPDSPSKSVPKIGSFCLNPAVDKPTVGDFKDVAVLTKDQLRDEHNTCVQLKKSIKQDIVSWCDAFQAKLNRPPTLEEKTEIQPLYKRYSDVEAHLRLVKHRLEGLVAQEKAKKAQETSVFHQLSAATGGGGASASAAAAVTTPALKPTSSQQQLNAMMDAANTTSSPELDRLSTRKKKLKQDIQDWCTQFQLKHGHPPTVADKKDVQGLYEEYAAIDAKIKTLKYSSAETVLVSSPPPVAAAPLPANLSLGDLVNLVHDALDAPTPLAPRDLAQRILAIHEVMDGQKCSTFLRVDGVESNSPAAQAGLQVGDLVGRFGPVVKVSTATHSTLIRQVVTVVNARVGKGVSISLQRGSASWRHLVLKPQKWQGKGLLGCVLQPYEPPAAASPPASSLQPAATFPPPKEQPNDLAPFEALSVPLPEPMTLPLGDLIFWHHKLLDGLDSLSTVTTSTKDAIDATKRQLEATAGHLTDHIQRLMTESNAIPFLKVECVETSSPASVAGLRPGDLLGRVGSVMYYNGATHATLIKDMVSLVNERTNHGISISLLRGNRTWVPLVLRPHKWSGQGLLGCILHPFEAPERVKKHASTLKLSATPTQPIPPQRGFASVGDLPSPLSSQQAEPAPEPATKRLDKPARTETPTSLATKTPPEDIPDPAPSEESQHSTKEATEAPAVDGSIHLVPTPRNEGDVAEVASVPIETNSSLPLASPRLLSSDGATDMTTEVVVPATSTQCVSEEQASSPPNVSTTNEQDEKNAPGHTRETDEATDAVSDDTAPPTTVSEAVALPQPEISPAVAPTEELVTNKDEPTSSLASEIHVEPPSIENSAAPTDMVPASATEVHTSAPEVLMAATPVAEPAAVEPSPDPTTTNDDPTALQNDALPPEPVEAAVEAIAEESSVDAEPNIQVDSADDTSTSSPQQQQGLDSETSELLLATAEEPAPAPMPQPHQNEGVTSMPSMDQAQNVAPIEAGVEEVEGSVIPQELADHGADKVPFSMGFDSVGEEEAASPPQGAPQPQEGLEDSSYNFPVDAFGIFEEISGNAALAGLEDNDYLVRYDGMPAPLGTLSNNALLDAFSKCTAFPLRIHVARWNVDTVQYEPHTIELESWDGVGMVLPIVAAVDDSAVAPSASVEEPPVVDHGGAFAQVNEVYDTSPADNGGLMVGDLVFWITDLPAFPTLETVSDWIGSMYSASQPVEIHVYRYSVDDTRYDELVLQIQPDRWCAPQLHLASAVRRNVELLGVDLIFFDIPVPQTIHPPFLLVEHVNPASPAADAGLVAGDWIGKMGQLTAATSSSNPADDVMGQVHLYIDKAMPIQLGRFDRTTLTMQTIDVTLRPASWEGEGLLGCQLAPWTPQEMAPLLVVETLAPGSPSDPAIQEGDLILRVGDHVHPAAMQDVSLYVDSHDAVLLVLQRWDPIEMTYKTLPLVVASSGDAAVWSLDSIDLFGWHCVTNEAYWARFEEAHPAELPCKECWATTFSTVAHAAAYAGHDACLRYLGECFDVFVIDSLGRTPLFYACYANQVDCIQLLLSLDYSNLKEAIDANGDTPLHAATSGGALGAIAVLLQAGCNPEPINYSGMRPVHVAPSADALQALAAGQADLLALDGCGRMALSYACMAGDDASVQYLVGECTEFIDFPDPEGDTPLHFAAAGGFLPCVQAIVEVSSKYVLRPNKAQRTALDVARDNAANAEMVAYLEQSCVLDDSIAPP